MVIRVVVICLCLFPVIAGLTGALLPATGWFPPLGGRSISLEPFRDLLDQPGLLTSVWLSLFTALLSTFIAYWLAMLLLALLFGQGRTSWLFRLISPLLSVPHITIAAGFLFLLQPSGWLSRLISPWLTGWIRPPNLNIVPDEYGLALIAGLIAKEMPFLLLMGLSAMSQIKTRPYMDAAGGLGYGLFSAWLHIIQPQLSARLVLPVLIVLIFAVSVVDMALILAPSTPAPLAVRILIWFRDPDLSYQFIAAAGAVSQLCLALICCMIWWIGGKLFWQVMRKFSYYGYRFDILSPILGRRLSPVLTFITILPCLLAALGLVTNIIWAFANVWRYPSALPDSWGVRAWARTGDSLFQAALNSLTLGLAASALCVLLAICWLEAGGRQKNGSEESFIYVPLLIPQIAFLFGLQILLIWLRFDGKFFALLWAHCLFVFPYVMLSLAPSWRRFDTRYTALAATLGAGRIRQFMMIKLPFMTVPLLTSLAVGFSVSLALYLPTIFAGNGRAITLTTEAVTLASSASRQSLGVASLMQMILPLVIFLGCGQLGRLRLSKFSYFGS